MLEHLIKDIIIKSELPIVRIRISIITLLSSDDLRITADGSAGVLSGGASARASPAWLLVAVAVTAVSTISVAVVTVGLGRHAHYFAIATQIFAGVWSLACVASAFPPALNSATLAAAIAIREVTVVTYFSIISVAIAAIESAAGVSAGPAKLDSAVLRAAVAVVGVVIITLFPGLDLAVSTNRAASV